MIPSSLFCKAVKPYHGQSIHNLRHRRLHPHTAGNTRATNGIDGKHVGTSMLHRRVHWRAGGTHAIHIVARLAGHIISSQVRRSHHVGVHGLPRAGEDLDGLIRARRGDDRVRARHRRDNVLHHPEGQLVRHSGDAVRPGSLLCLLADPLQHPKAHTEKSGTKKKTLDLGMGDLSGCGRRIRRDSRGNTA